MPPETGTSESETSPSRKWFAITLATLVMMVCYSAILFGVAGGFLGEGEDGAAMALAAGLIGVPAVFLGLAFVSRHPQAPKATLKAMGLFLLVGLPVSLLSLPAGMVGGFGAGGVVALRLGPTDTTRARAWAVALSASYIMVVGQIVPPIDALVGSVFPFLAIGAADSITRKRAERVRDADTRNA